MAPGTSRSVVGRAPAPVPSPATGSDPSTEEIVPWHGLWDTHSWEGEGFLPRGRHRSPGADFM